MKGSLPTGLQKLHDEYPHLKTWEVSAEKLNEFLNKGTMNRAGVWSPCTGRPGLIALTMDDLRRQGQQGLLGTQMTAVVVEATKPGKKTTFKKYRLPDEQELKAAEVEIEDLETVFQDIPFGIPDEPTPAGGGSGASVHSPFTNTGLRNGGICSPQGNCWPWECSSSIPERRLKRLRGGE